MYTTLLKKIYLSVSNFIEENERTMRFVSLYRNSLYGEEESGFLDRHPDLLEQILLEDDGSKIF